MSKMYAQNLDCLIEGPLDEPCSGTSFSDLRVYATDSEHHALRMVDRLTQRSEKIADFPKIGRKVPEYEDEKSEKFLKSHTD